MTNYFGKARLIKLFYHYISDRTEFLKSFKAYVNEFGKEIMFLYKKYRGSEWLEIHHDGYYFKFYVFGQVSKTIDFKEYRIDFETDGDGGELTTKTCIVRIISYYTADFYPFVNNKDKTLDCYTISKKQRKPDAADLVGKDCDVIFLDTETTGLDPEADEILQISVMNNSGEILLNSYIRPEHKTEWTAAEAINHISPQMVKNAPLMSDIAPLISKIMSGAKVAVAYNIDFDWHFISKALEKSDFDFENDTPELRCCMKKFSEIYGEWDSERLRYRWQKLSTAASYYNIPWRGQAYGSLADTFMCRDVWNKMNDD